VRNGDRIRIDLRRGDANLLVDQSELDRRRSELETHGGCDCPESQTPWQEMQRVVAGQLSDAAILEPAAKYQRLAQKFGVPRHSH
jgi:dihydroxy-acid dehydratase